MKTKNILIITHHRPNRSPGQRFRFEQYLDFLTENNYRFTWDILLDEKDDKIFYGSSILAKFKLIIKLFFKRLKTIRKAKHYDGILLYREAFVIGGAFFEKIIAKKNPNIWFDFDDAIWLPNVSEKNKKWSWLKRPEKTIDIIKISKIVTCGNQYLTRFAANYNPNSKLIPTTINTHYHTTKTTHQSPTITIGWTGSSTTLPYFEQIIPVLARLKTKFGQQIDFKIIVDTEKSYPELQAKTTPWQLNTEIRDLHQIDIGIMPLPDDEWSKGKCGFKILQYMGIGIPAVASSVGANIDIIQHGENGFLAQTPQEWESFLTQLITSSELRQRIGQAGRKTVEQHYSVEANKDKYLAVLHTLTHRY